MTIAAFQSRIARLEALGARLSDGEVHGVDDLASSLEVSKRTLFRDLAVLREQGWDLESASGKGGGVRILQRWPSGSITLRAEDAVELLLSLALAESMGLSPLGRHEALRRQFARCFAPADRSLIAQLRRRMRTASPVSLAVQSTANMMEPDVRSHVYRAFGLQQLVEFNYVDGQGQESQRIVEPHCLLLAWPYWFLLSWDRQRESVRTFRLDRMRRVRVLSAHFQLRDLRQFWEGCNEVGVQI